MRAALPLLMLLTLACRTPEEAKDLDADGYVEDDCDDLDPDVHPGADELCNSIDDDCDGDVDEEPTDAPLWYADADGDGWGDDTVTLVACEQPTDHVEDGGDCDDSDTAFHPGAAETDCTDPSDYNCDGSVGFADADGDGWAACEECDDSEAAVNPGADEVCNDVDDDCDGDVDQDAVDAPTWYFDADEDGYGRASAALESCDQPGGYVDNAEDCDDLWAAAYPGGTEVCDAHDNDCDGTVDEDDAVDAQTFFQDLDGDGFGDASHTTAACEAPSGFVEDDEDCDDTEASVHPDATEACNEVDDDCDGTTDEDDAVDASTWYADFDGDGYGSSVFTTDACEQPPGYVSDATDCNDLSDDAYPGGTEVCDELDNDCDGDTDESDATDALTWYADADGDGYGDATSTTGACDQPTGYVADATDCDDADEDVSPAEDELCNEVDDDCDGDVDEDDAIDALTWYEDRDEDGYGNALYATTACEQPTGYTTDDSDCDDLHAASYPGGEEVCDEHDNDCDGTVDEDDAVDALTWYEDLDGDGYGSTLSTEACEEPSGYTSDSGDCDDTDASVNPGESEVYYDGVDTDCDGASDWDADLDGYDSYVEAGGEDCDDTDASAWACGSTAALAGQSCAEILDSDSTAADGLYYIDPDDDGDTTDAWQAWCDMSRDDGGWTLVLQNNDAVSSGSNLNWSTAVSGVTVRGGTLSSSLADFDLWVGVSEWTQIGDELRVEVGSTAGSPDCGSSFDFDLTGSEYALALSNETTTTGACGSPGIYSYHNGYRLTTSDNDNDAASYNCSNYYGHPWWYRSCWSGSFWGGSGHYQAAYWTSSGTSDWDSWGAIWVR